MSKNFDLQQQKFIKKHPFGCPHINRLCNHTTMELCDPCIKELMATNVIPVAVAVGGGSACEAPDVKPLQHLRRDQLCQDCQKGDPQQGCLVCETMGKTLEIQPFTKEAVEQLHQNLKNQFKPSRTGRTFALGIRLDNPNIGSIDWNMHNCAFSSLVLMLSSSNAGMNSINQKIFEGYLLALIINSLQETGKCNTIFLEVFRFELTVLSGNPAWSNWSELTGFQELYNFCVDNKIIIDDKVQFVPPEMNVAQFLDGKVGSVCVEAQKWVPSRTHFANGVCSSNVESRFHISAIILHNGSHFSVIIVKDGFWLIDSKGEMLGEFTAMSTITRLTCVEAQKLCAQHGAFYFLEEVPQVYENVLLSGKMRLPPIKVFYQDKTIFIHDDGAFIIEKTKKGCCLKVSFIGIDEFGKHIRVFPYLPPPPASPAPYAQVARALPPSLPPAHRAQVSLVPEHKRSSITEYDIVVSAEKWICSIDPEYYGRVEKTPHPKYPITMMDVYFYQNVSHTTLDALVKFINFIKSIQ
jgi:hypothetical protein